MLTRSTYHKTPSSSNGTTVDGYLVGIVNTSDYSPFGVQLDGRTVSNGRYRYGFNRMEGDPEIKGQGNSINYKARIYDTRLGRFLSVDPLTESFPFYTPYQFAGNMPIIAIDLDGLEPKYMISENGRLTRPMITLMNSAFDYNIKRMEKTKWKEKTFDFGAITLYKTVKYDPSYNNEKNKNPSKWVGTWSDLIVHEQKHRDEIGNNFFRALGWYIGYGFDYLFAGFDYFKINAEERAYGMEPSMKGLMAFKNGIALDILQSNKNDTEKSDALKYIGLSYKLDVSESNLKSLQTKLSDYSGNKRGKKRLERKIARLENSIDSLKTEVNNSNTDSVKKTISDVKK